MHLQLQYDGRLIILQNERERTFDFNRTYEGYYPFCRWTAVGRWEALFLAGTDRGGVPHLFSSAGGETWTEQNIRTRIGLPDPKEYGDIIRILFEEKEHQVFLVTRNGYLVTLPDCPKCVRARRVSDRPLADARMDGEYILLTDAYAEQIRIPSATVSQYRCAWSFAMPFLKEGGLLFDLRSREEKELPVPAAISIDMGDLEGLLGRMPKGRPMFFFCSHGYLADQAVRDARDAGFSHSWSLGGIFDLLQEEKGI